MSHLNISYFTSAKHSAKFVEGMVNQGVRNMHRRGSGCNSVVRTALAQHIQDSRFNFHDQKQKSGEWKGDTYNINLLRTISWITNEKRIVHSTGQCTQ